MMLSPLNPVSWLVMISSITSDTMLTRGLQMIKEFLNHQYEIRVKVRG